MNSLIPDSILPLLLRDRTTGRNIFWATHDYEHLGKGYGYKDEILPELITGEHSGVIMPRVLKSRQQQTDRSKDMAEVFTPSWICNAQNNLVDEAWAGRKNVFNKEVDSTVDADLKSASHESGISNPLQQSNPLQRVHTWKNNLNPITFPDGKAWQDYVSQTCLEITCGEAPYLVSRYDTTTGAPIPLPQRIGLLDRKIHVINEHTETADDWLLWVHTAYQNTYGYEWQGDNLLLARINLLTTFVEYYADRFHEQSTEEQVSGIAEIISWNLWQMDGLRGVPPDYPSPGEILEHPAPDMFTEYCLIRDWESGKPLRYIDLFNL